MPGGVAINAGGGAAAAGDGTAYRADGHFAGGRTYSTARDIAGTADDGLYQTVRYAPGGFGYDVPLANGEYDVTLKFAEVYFTRPGQRVFDVRLEGQKFADLTGLDLVARAGAYTAHDVTHRVRVSDGVLDVDFLAGVENPMVSAIRVTPAPAATAATAATAGGTIDGPHPVFARELNRLFDGADDKVVVIDHEPALELAEGTVALTFTAAGLIGTQGLLSKDSEGFDDGGHLGVWLEGDRVAVRLQGRDTDHQLTSGAGAVKAGVESQVAVSFGADGLRLYVDGAPVAEDGYRGGLRGNQEPLVLGARDWLSGDRAADHLDALFHGAIAGVAVFDHQLGAEELRELTAAPHHAWDLLAV